MLRSALGVRGEARGSLNSIDDRLDSAFGGGLDAEPGAEPRGGPAGRPGGGPVGRPGGGPAGDRDVLEAARSGDRQALESLLVAHYDRVHALCRRMLGNEADAMDATQDALLAAVRAFDRFDGRSTFSTWIYRVATNACIDELRRRRRRPTPGSMRDVAEDGTFGTGSGGGTDLWRNAPAVHATSALWGISPPAEDGADDVSFAVATRVDVDRALAALPAELRAAVVLRDVCDLPYDEIATVMDVPIGTVRSRIARGRAAVAALLSGANEAPASVDGSVGNPAGVAYVETVVVDPPPPGAPGVPDAARPPRPTP